MGGLDERLQQLESLIGGAVGRSEAVNGTLEQRQAAIMELKQTRELLRQLQMVLEVPRKLRAALTQGAYEVAVDIYEDVAPVLEKHGHRKALRKVSAEVEICRAEAAEWLRGQLHTSPESAAESIQLIARLGESTASLMDDFLGCQRRRLSAALTAGESALQDLNIPLQESFSTLNSTFLVELIRTGNLFEQLFDAAARPKMVAEAREWFLKYTMMIRTALERTATASVAAAAGLNVTGKRIASTNSTTTTNTQVGFSEDWGAEGLVAALDTVRIDFVQLESVLPELSSRDKASELVGNAVRQHVGLAFTAVEARIAGELADIRVALSEKVIGAEIVRQRAQLAISELSLTALRGLEHAIRGVAQWGAHPWTLEGWKEVFCTLLQAHAANWLLAVPNRCLAAADLISEGSTQQQQHTVQSNTIFSEAWIVPQNEVTPIFVLALSVLCSCGHTRLADRAEELLSRQTGGVVAPGWVGDAISAASNTAGKLLVTYKAAISTELSAMLVAAVHETPWGAHPEARAPRAVCIHLLDALYAVDADLQAAEQEAAKVAVMMAPHADSSQRQHHHLHHHRRSSTGGGGSASVDMSLSGFISSGPIGNVAWGSRAEVLAGALQAALHGNAVALRKYTLSRTAFQQVQLDCHFLRPQLQRMVETGAGGGAAVAVLDEVLVVAAERCGEPVMLEPAVLDRMVAASSSQSQLTRQ